MSGNLRFDALLQELAALHAAKNHDYAGSARQPTPAEHRARETAEYALASLGAVGPPAVSEALRQIIAELDPAAPDPLANLRDFGWRGVVVRLGDKYSRIKNFAKSGALAVKTESIRDTFQDMAVYSLLAIILLDEEGTVNWGKP